MYLSGGNFASRLPQEVKDAIRKHGIRNSHLLSIAPTGTISLAFADNASNGIEPPFSWTYTRKKRMVDGTLKEYRVEDYAWRLYKHSRRFGYCSRPFFIFGGLVSDTAHRCCITHQADRTRFRCCVISSCYVPPDGYSAKSCSTFMREVFLALRTNCHRH